MASVVLCSTLPLILILNDKTDWSTINLQYSMIWLQKIIVSTDLYSLLHPEGVHSILVFICC